MFTYRLHKVCVSFFFKFQRQTLENKLLINTYKVIYTIRDLLKNANAFVMICVKQQKLKTDEYECDRKSSLN